MGDRRVGTGDAVRGDRSVVVDFAPAMNALVSNVLNANSTSTTRAFPGSVVPGFGTDGKGFRPEIIRPPACRSVGLSRTAAEAWEPASCAQGQTSWLTLSTDFPATGASSRSSAHCRYGPIPGEAARAGRHPNRPRAARPGALG